MSQTPDGLVRMPLRVMHLMECVPGYVQKIGGQPITILTLAHNDQVEEPMLLSLYDSKRLLIRLLTALANHRDDFADWLVEEHFSEPDYDDPFKVKHSEFDPAPLPASRPKRVVYPLKNPRFLPVDPPEDPRSAPPTPPSVPQVPSSAPAGGRGKPWTRPLTDRKASVCKCVVQYGREYRPRNSFSVFGGYSDGKSHLVLMRRRGSNAASEDGVAKLLPNGQINIWGDNSGDFLHDDQWESFLKLTKGKRFTFNGTQWTKMDVQTLATLTHGKTFKAVPRL